MIIIVKIAFDWMSLVRLYPNPFLGQAEDVSTVENIKDQLLKPQLEIIPGTEKRCYNCNAT